MTTDPTETRHGPGGIRHAYDPANCTGCRDDELSRQNLEAFRPGSELNVETLDVWLRGLKAGQDWAWAPTGLVWRVRRLIAELLASRAEVYRLNLEVHWLECPLPPDAGCEPCHERTRQRCAHPKLRWSDGELHGSLAVRDAENERFRRMTR